MGQWTDEKKKGRRVEVEKKLQITMPKITYKKTKASHGLHQNSFKLQTMTGLIKSFCRGPGGGFFKKSPLAAGGRTR